LHQPTYPPPCVLPQLTCPSYTTQDAGGVLRRSSGQLREREPPIACLRSNHGAGAGSAALWHNMQRPSRVPPLLLCSNVASLCLRYARVHPLFCATGLLCSAASTVVILLPNCLPPLPPPPPASPPPPQAHPAYAHITISRFSPKNLHIFNPPPFRFLTATAGPL